MGEENSKNIGDFTFDNYNEKNYDKDKETAMELMCRHFEFYGQLNSPDIEYATRGAKLSCTHGNKYIYLDAVKDHGVYDGDHPVLTCKDCKVNENIYDFGACGNGKFEPLYSKDAPHPAETALNQKGEKRYVCRPILLGGWGYGDINSRSLLIGEVNMDKEYKMYKKESANDGKPSEYISHCINTIESQNETKNPIDAMQNREEILEEYVEALMTCDNLVCLYGGVITIVENSETEEETIVEEDLEPEETMVEVDEMVEEINVRTCSEKLKIFLKSYETGGERHTLDDKLINLSDGMPATTMYYDFKDYPTIGWGHKIEGNGEYNFSNGTIKNLYQDTITLDEAEEIFNNDINIKQASLNKVLRFSTTQREYDMLLSMTYNAGIGLLTNSSNSQTKRWFETGGYKNIEYSKFVLGDITSGGLLGAKNRKADELEILMGIDYDKKTDDYDRIKSENGESIWNRPDKIDELAEMWEDSLEYKDEKADIGNS